MPAKPRLMIFVNYVGFIIPAYQLIGSTEVEASIVRPGPFSPLTRVRVMPTWMRSMFSEVNGVKVQAYVLVACDWLFS